MAQDPIDQSQPTTKVTLMASGPFAELYMFWLRFGPSESVCSF